jgi:short-subunit dehydrogenase
MGRINNSAILGIAGIGLALALRENVRRRREITFPGKVVLISGGSRGLGLEIARQLADKGAKLALAARDLDELKRAQTELERYGGEVFIVPCDITERRETEEIVHSVQDRLGPIDILINNAGTIQVGPLEEMTLEDYEDAMKVHFWAPLHMIQAVLPSMRARQRGRIVNISSVGGKIAVPHLAPYSASKFALVGLSEGMRAELSAQHIYVTTACPGLMRTGSHLNANFKGQHKKEYTWFSIANGSPLLSASAEEAASEIIRACKYGDPEVMLPLTTKAATLFSAVFPGLMSDVLSLVNRVLPGPGGIGQGHAAGKDSQTPLAPSMLTGLSEDAALRNNEIPAV